VFWPAARKSQAVCENTLAAYAPSQYWSHEESSGYRRSRLARFHFDAWGFGQSLGNAGTIEGVVVDPSGAAVARAVVSVHILSRITGSHLIGFGRLLPIGQRSAQPVSFGDQSLRLCRFLAGRHNPELVPVQVKASLEIAGGQTSVTVEASGADLLEVNPPITSMPIERSFPSFPRSTRRRLSQAITYSTGGVAADGNGLFTPSATTRRPAS